MKERKALHHRAAAAAAAIAWIIGRLFYVHMYRLDLSDIKKSVAAASAAMDLPFKFIQPPLRNQPPSLPSRTLTFQLSMHES